MCRRVATDHPPLSSSALNEGLGMADTLLLEQNPETEVICWEYVVHFEVGIIPCLIQAKNVLGHQGKTEDPRDRPCSPRGYNSHFTPGGEYWVKKRQEVSVERHHFLKASHANYGCGVTRGLLDSCYKTHPNISKDRRIQGNGTNERASGSSPNMDCMRGAREC
jgi:hypothetical protein